MKGRPLPGEARVARWQTVRGFGDRRQAGRALGARLSHLRGLDPVVVAVPRGGVPVGYEVAAALDAPLGVLAVRGGLTVGVAGRAAIVTDDGVAAGGPDLAALEAIRKRGPRRLVLAVPVCPPDSLKRLTRLTDEVVCLISPAHMIAVGHWYRDFTPVSEDEVLRLLAAAAKRRPGGSGLPVPGRSAASGP
ncbi:MAG: hypothetical protein U0R52_07895 [Solirubrobacterales bacterium]